MTDIDAVCIFFYDFTCSDSHYNTIVRYNFPNLLQIYYFHLQPCCLKCNKYLIAYKTK